MIIRYYTCENLSIKDVIPDELSQEIVVGYNLYSFSTIALSSYIITMISYEKDIESIPFHIKKPFNIIDDHLIKDCISDMLKVYKLIHEDI